jgi:hypothetical protein
VTVEYDILLEDMIAFGHIMQRQRKLSLLSRCFSWTNFYISWLIFLFFFLHLLITAASNAVRGLGFVGVLAILAIQKIGKRIWRKDYSVEAFYDQPGNDVFIGHRTLTTSESGFSVVGEMSTANYSWTAVYRLVSTHDHIFVFIAPIAAQIIPLRAVDTTIREFLVKEFSERSGKPCETS